MMYLRIVSPLLHVYGFCLHAIHGGSMLSKPPPSQVCDSPHYYAFACTMPVRRARAPASYRCLLMAAWPAKVCAIVMQIHINSLQNKVLHNDQKLGPRLALYEPDT
ncbi:MAG: hypothetical protein GC149_11430 [Gammaproteobacteria bacterium]|nr:hypothetical protein [Gammaproteobacteria bacterium]